MENDLLELLDAILKNQIAFYNYEITNITNTNCNFFGAFHMLSGILELC